MNHKLLFLLLLFPFQVFSQNLVPNGDFENKNGCPTSSGQYRLAEGWFCPNTGTPDYFNDCSNSLDYGTEFNFKGGQMPHSGHGYMGFISENLHRNAFYEYLETTLSEPLTAGQVYCIRMFVSLGNSSCALRELGVVFSQSPIKVQGTGAIRIPFSSLSNGSVLAETQDWICLKVSYTAKGGETFLTIGDFGDDTNFVWVQNDPSLNTTFKSAYYFIDDVSVEVIQDTGCTCPGAK